MSTDHTPLKPALDIERLSAHYHIPLPADQVPLVQAHWNILSQHAETLMAFTLPEAIEPAAEFTP